MNEEWRAVLGYEGFYEVSSLGRVRRCRGGRGATAGRILSVKRPNRTNDYCRVQLCRGDVKRTFGVHVLVCEAFHGRRPRNKLPNHKDLDKLNNTPSNLEWLTRKQNSRHALANGRRGGSSMPRASNGRSKLSDAQVAEIRRLRGVVGQRPLAVLCGVSKTCIQAIHQGRHWRE